MNDPPTELIQQMANSVKQTSETQQQLITQIAQMQQAMQHLQMQASQQPLPFQHHQQYPPYQHQQYHQQQNKWFPRGHGHVRGRGRGRLGGGYPPGPGFKVTNTANVVSEEVIGDNRCVCNLDCIYSIDTVDAC